MDEFKMCAYRFTPTTGSLQVHGISTTSNLGLQCVVESYNTLILSVCQQYSKNYLFSVLKKAVLSVVGKVIFYVVYFTQKMDFLMR